MAITTTRSVHHAAPREQPLALIISAAPFDCRSLSEVLPGWTVLSANGNGLRATRGRQAQIVIVDATAATRVGPNVRPLISDACAKFAGSPVALLVRVNGVTERELLKAHNWNRIGLLFAGIDDQAGVAPVAIARARAVHLAQRLMQSMPIDMPAWIAEVFERSVVSGYLRLRASTLAECVGIGERALNKRLAALGLGSACQIIKLGECLAAIDALEAGIWNVGEITSIMGLRQPRTLRRALRRYFDCSPSQAFAGGGVLTAITRIRAVVLQAMASRPAAWNKARSIETHAFRRRGVR